MASYDVSTAYGLHRYIQISLDRSEPLAATRDDAQIVLDEVWKVLDSAALPFASTDIQFFQYRTKLRKLSLKLSSTHDILPSSLILRGVQCADTDKMIGSGSFADVFAGTYRGKKVALKRPRAYIMIEKAKKDRLRRDFCRESILWKNLVNAHIVPFLGIAEDVPFPDQLCMVISWMKNGSLRDRLAEERKKGPLVGAKQVAELDRWLYQISEGLAYLHDEGIVHGDLHDGNVLLDQNETACLTDFGMALVTEATPYGLFSIHGGGAPLFKAPELHDPEEFGLDGTRMTPESDMFSFACVCIEVCNMASQLRVLFNVVYVW